MKIKKIINLFTIIILITVNQIIAQNQVYDYPNINSEEIKNLSFNELIQIHQIPKNILSNLSTDTLIKTCIKYPLFTRIFGINNYKIGAKTIFNEFNGFRELFGRPDATPSLIKAYQQMKPCNYNWNNINKKTPVDLVFIKLMLNRTVIINKLNDNELIFLSNEIVNKLIKKSYLNNGFFANYDLNVSAFLLANILTKRKSFTNYSNKLQNNIKKFTNTGYCDFETKKFIIEQSNSNKDTNSANISDIKSKSIITIYTPRGTPVFVYKENREYSNNELLYFNNIFSWYVDKYNDPDKICRIGDASPQYNCHGYAWHVSEGGGNVDMSIFGEVKKYWEDGSYIQVSDEKDAKKIEYYNINGNGEKTPSHSAIASPLQGVYISKWALCGLYKHRADICEPMVTNTRNRDYYVPTKIKGCVNIPIYSLKSYSVANITNGNFLWTSSNNIVINNINKNKISAYAKTNIGSAWIKVVITSHLNSKTVSVTSKINIKIQDIPHNPSLKLNNFNVRISPNPALNYIDINIENKLNNSCETCLYKILFFNSNQNLLKNFETASQTNRIDLHNYKKGNYFLHVIYKDNIVRKQILIK